MDLNNIKQKWSEFTAKMNKLGVPLPTIRDPKSGLGSISLTLVFISFNMVLIGLVGKWAGALGGIDLTQALNLFYACAALYWGRKFQGGNSSLGEAALSNQSPIKDEPVPSQKPDDPDAQ